MAQGLPILRSELFFGVGEVRRKRKGGKGSQKTLNYLTISSLLSQGRIIMVVSFS